MTKRTAPIQFLATWILGFGVLAFCILSGAPIGGWVGSEADVEASRIAREANGHNVPEFSWVKGKPVAKGCVSWEAWNESVSHFAKNDLRRIPSEVVSINLRGEAHREATGVAWERAGVAVQGSYWLVAACE